MTVNRVVGSVIAGCLVGLLLLAGCAAAGARAEDRSPGVQTAVGARFTLEQEGNITTGYSWKATYDEAYLRLVDESYDASSDRVGAGGVFTFTFSALREGKTTVKLVYKRPWESEVLKTQEYTVAIAPGSGTAH